MNGDPRFSAAPGSGRAAAPPPGDSAALIGGVVQLITAHPALLLEHAQAHAALLALDLAAGAGRLKRQALWWAGALCSTLAGVMLAGVALMFWLMRDLPSALAADPAQTAWLLAGIPAAALLLAGVCLAGALGLFDGRVPARPGLLARLQDDLDLLRATPS